MIQRLSFLAFLFISILPVQAQKTDAFDALLAKQMKTDSIPGATLLIAKNGKTLKVKGYGLANMENAVPAKPDTHYEMASISKPVTATAMMLLVEQGKISLDSSVAAYIPNSPDAYKQITIRQVMSHIGGIPSDHYVHTKLYAPSLLRYTAKDQLADLFKLKPIAPGTKFVYSNAGFFLQGAIIEQVTGRNYKEFVQENILDKAGMWQTSFLNGDSLVPNRAQQYTKRKGTWVRFSLETLMQSLDANGFSGLISTAADLDRFCTALSDGKIISAHSFNTMMQRAKLNDGNFAYSVGNSSQPGLGWFVKDIAGEQCIFHSGHTGTVLLYFPAKRLTIVLLTNLGGGYGGIAGDKGFKVADVGFELAELALKQFAATK